LCINDGYVCNVVRLCKIVIYSGGLRKVTPGMAMARWPTLTPLVAPTWSARGQRAGDDKTNMAADVR
jgi:hypothetical protein